MTDDRKVVVFVIGASGSGKRRAASALKEIYPDALTCSVRKLQREFFEQTNQRLPESSWEVNQFARYYSREFNKFKTQRWGSLLGGPSCVIMSMSSLTESGRTWYIGLAKKAQRKLIAVTLEIDADTLRTRLINEKRYEQKFVDDTVSNLHQYQRPTYVEGFDEIHILDQRGKF